MHRWLPFRTILGVLVVGLALYLLSPQQGSAEKATRQEMEQVCTNWLSYMVYQKGDWGGGAQPRIVGVEEVVVDDQVLALNFSIAPRGHVVVPVLKDLPPIKAYSDEYDLNLDECGGFAQLLREVLQHRADLFSETYGSLEATQPITGEVIFDRVHRQQWDRFSIDSPQFTGDLKAGVLGEMYEGRPLLATAWHQEDPYNASCPWGDQNCVTCPAGHQPYNAWPSLVGCVATATAQIMNFHQWPQSGTGSKTYTWNGDGTCNTPGSAGATLSATFSDSYDWANMPNRCYSSSPQAQQDAVAELCYEVGVAFSMDYGVCGSFASTNAAITVLNTHFRYSKNIFRADRNNYTADTWFDFIRAEIDRGRPMLYRIQYDALGGHAIVCDGWRDTGGDNQYHINYGWGGPYTGWYAIDNIHHTYDVNSEYLIHDIRPAKTLSVCHDGSDPYTTIYDAILAASDGDVIELCDGRYIGAKNRNLQYSGKKIIIRSKSGNAEACTIDCQGQGRAFQFGPQDNLHSVLKGVTITGGYHVRGGAIKCLDSAPTITGCIMTGNSTSADGAGIFCYNSSPNISFCIFSDNSAGQSGGGVACWEESRPYLRHCTFTGNTSATQGGGISYVNNDVPSRPCTVKVDNCTFHDNSALAGGGMFCHNEYPPMLTHCIFWDDSANQGGGLYCRDDSPPRISNCTFYGNWATHSGGGMWLSGNCSDTVENTIISFSTQGEGIHCQNNSTPHLKCCDIYGNADGDWEEEYSFYDQLGLRGNMESDPLFVDATNGDFSLQSGSPCAPMHSPPGCGLIGTLGLSPEVSGEISNLLIPNTEQCVNPGDYVCLPILLDNNTTPFGGFELEVEFDYTSMTFVGAEPGELADGFEYFTYRLLPCPLCGCCKYKILLYGQYDLPNGVENLGDPIGITPIGEFHELANLCFVVNNDENLRGLKIPVCWEWEGEVVNDTLVEDRECSENTFSSWSGDTLFTSSLLCQFNPEICDDPGDRIQPVLIFQAGVCGQNCGGIDICPAGPGECKRGDVNYNTITYEVADAVLFASYFVEGLPVFRYVLPYQVCATDVNADGRTLTLSDLVYLIRVILHDAVEIPKLSPSVDVAGVVVSDGVVTTQCASQIGALLFEFDGAVEPILLAENMEMLNRDNKVLVWSREGNSIENAQVISFSDVKLVSVAAVDRDGRELETTIVGKGTVPSDFALHPAYPNPFNMETQIRFDLPQDCRVSLKIYNIRGQLVRTLIDEQLSAERYTFSWGGTNQSGGTVASGVYFYKLTAGSFSATQKMVMMK